MARNKLSEKVAQIGRWIGTAKRKQKDVVQLWLDLCNANGVKPSDRVLELIAWDLENGGVDLKNVGRIQGEKEIGKVLEELTLAQQLGGMIKEFMNQMINREYEHTQEITSLLDTIKQLQAQSMLQSQNNTNPQLNQQYQPSPQINPTHPPEENRKLPGKKK